MSAAHVSLPKDAASLPPPLKGFATPATVAVAARSLRAGSRSRRASRSVASHFGIHASGSEHFGSTPNALGHGGSLRRQGRQGSGSFTVGPRSPLRVFGAAVVVRFVYRLLACVRRDGHIFQQQQQRSPFSTASAGSPITASPRGGAGSGKQQDFGRRKDVMTRQERAKGEKLFLELSPITSLKQFAAFIRAAGFNVVSEKAVLDLFGSRTHGFTGATGRPLKQHEAIRVMMAIKRKLYAEVAANEQATAADVLSALQHSARQERERREAAAAAAVAQTPPESAGDFRDAFGSPATPRSEASGAAHVGFATPTGTEGALTMRELRRVVHDTIGLDIRGGDDNLRALDESDIEALIGDRRAGGRLAGAAGAAGSRRRRSQVHLAGDPTAAALSALGGNRATALGASLSAGGTQSAASPMGASALAARRASTADTEAGLGLSPTLGRVDTAQFPSDGTPGLGSGASSRRHPDVLLNGDISGQLIGDAESDEEETDLAREVRALRDQVNRLELPKRPQVSFPPRSVQQQALADRTPSVARNRLFPKLHHRATTYTPEEYEQIMEAQRRREKEIAYAHRKKPTTTVQFAGERQLPRFTAVESLACIGGAGKNAWDTAGADALDEDELRMSREVARRKREEDALRQQEVIERLKLRRETPMSRELPQWKQAWKRPPQIARVPNLYRHVKATGLPRLASTPTFTLPPNERAAAIAAAVEQQRAQSALEDYERRLLSSPPDNQRRSASAIPGLPDVRSLAAAACRAIDSRRAPAFANSPSDVPIPVLRGTSPDAVGTSSPKESRKASPVLRSAGGPGSFVSLPSRQPQSPTNKQESPQLVRRSTATRSIYGGRAKSSPKASGATATASMRRVPSADRQPTLDPVASLGDVLPSPTGSPVHATQPRGSPDQDAPAPAHSTKTAPPVATDASMSHDPSRQRRVPSANMRMPRRTGSAGSDTMRRVAVGGGGGDSTPASPPLPPPEASQEL